MDFISDETDYYTIILTVSMCRFHSVGCRSRSVLDLKDTGGGLRGKVIGFLREHNNLMIMAPPIPTINDNQWRGQKQFRGWFGFRGYFHLFWRIFFYFGAFITGKNSLDWTKKPPKNRNTPKKMKACKHVLSTQDHFYHNSSRDHSCIPLLNWISTLYSWWTLIAHADISNSCNGIIMSIARNMSSGHQTA